MNRLVFYVPLLASLVCISGCTTSGSTKLGQNLNSTTLKGSLPKGFPIAQYPGSKVVVSRRAPGGTNAMLTTADGSEKVEEFYRNDMKNSGWNIDDTVVQNANVDGTRIVVGFKGSEQVALGIFSEPNSKTSISINLTTLRNK
ncbi:MAG: hypothetical protein ACRD3W_28060 [Terriglobales bacterium]